MRHAASGIIGVIALAATAMAAIADGLDIHAGKALFERRWIASPSSTSSANGLGPLFNATSCDGCHKAGGAASFSVAGDSLAARGFVVRLVAPDGMPDPLYGRQLQERGVPGMVPEARIFPTLVKGGGEGVDALTRMIAVVRFNGPVPTSLSEIRVAPSLAGRGLIEQADEHAVMALADPDDRDGDGISGRVRRIATLDGRETVGRFGWKSASPSLAVSIATAAAVDMGLGSRLDPHPHGDCTTLQTACLARLTGIEAGSQAELDDEAVTLLSTFVASLKPPARPGQPPTAFEQARCGACHAPEVAARGGGTVTLFSDLLLHDMGANLSGPAPDGDAGAFEWRTAPLVDLAPRGGKRRYLHDGRAATVGEAIKWHGGEATAARGRFEALPAEEQAALIRYLESL